MTAIAPLSRTPFTDAVIAALAPLGFPVGDGKLPPGANWIGQPDAPDATFEPYFVVSEILASHSSGPIGDSQADWQLPYLIEAFGISRRQCSLLLDRGVAQVAEMRTSRFTVNSTPYGVQQVRVDSLAEPVGLDEFNPPLWHRQAGLTLWIGKGT